MVGKVREVKGRDTKERQGNAKEDKVREVKGRQTKERQGNAKEGK